MMIAQLRFLCPAVLCLLAAAHAHAAPACKDQTPHGEWKTADAVWWGHTNAAYGAYMPFETQSIPAPATVDEDFGIVYFDLDQFAIRASEVQTLEAIAGWMRENPGKRVTIEGHCCDLASDDYNMRLGQNRADAVKHWLVHTGGIDGQRIDTISYGKRDLVSPPPARHLNRRAVTIFEQP